MAISDAFKAFNDGLIRSFMFGDAKKKYTHYVEVHKWIKRLPLTYADRKVVGAADLSVELCTMPVYLASLAPTMVWVSVYVGRKWQNRYLRMIARQPAHVALAYAISAIFIDAYARAQIADKFFTRDSGVAQLAEKYQRDAISEGAKSEEAPDGFIYRLDGTSEGATSGKTDF